MRILHAGSARAGASPRSRRRPIPRRGDPRSAGREPVPLHRIREGPRRRARRSPGEGRRAMSNVLIIKNAAIATVDVCDTEYERGYLVARDGLIEAVGPGDAPRQSSADQVTVVDGAGCLLTPGLVNTHHHLYQWVTRGLAQNEALFGWLTELVSGLGTHRRALRRARRRAAGSAWLAKTGCTTSSDHHYVFPTHGGDLLGAEIDAARTIGLRSTRRAARCPGAVRRAACRRTNASSRWTPFCRRARMRSTASTTRASARWCGSRSRRARRSR